MIVVLKPISGTPKANLERAKHEMERVLAFRGMVNSTRAVNKSIQVIISINQRWDLPKEQKVGHLKEWITPKVRSSFKVVSVSI